MRCIGTAEEGYATGEPLPRSGATEKGTSPAEDTWVAGRPYWRRHAPILADGTSAQASIPVRGLWHQSCLRTRGPGAAQGSCRDALTNDHPVLTARAVALQHWH